MFLLIASILLPALFGITAACALKLFQEKITAILAGSVIGWTIFTIDLYILNIFFPLNASLVTALLLLVLLATVIIAYAGEVRDKWQTMRFDKGALIVLIILLALFGIIAPKLLIERDDGIYTGVINAYGDIAWHLSNITAFTEGQSVPPKNPILAGERLTYPFMSNYYSAILLTAGASYSQSVNLPALLLIPFLLTLFYCLVREASNGSRLTAIIALSLFLFGGATFGWIRFGDDLQTSNLALQEFLTKLPARDYSGTGTDKDGFHFLNPVTSLLLPQRPFLFGMPLAFTILLLLFPRKNKNDLEFVAAGILSGILPLFHAHTVLVLIPAILALFTISYNKKWLSFFLTTAIVGILPVYYYISGNNESGAFLRYEPGWTSNGTNFIWFWFKNTGFLIPAAIAGLFIPAPKLLKCLAASGLIIFATANIWLFAPWAWDNFKLLVFWLLFSLPLIGWIFAGLLQNFRSKIYIHLIVAAFMALHMVSASLDIWKLSLPTAQSWLLWDKNAIAMAEITKQNTSPQDSILGAPIHNSVPALAGRYKYLGYPAHIWSHGGSPWKRKNAVKDYFEGRKDSLPGIRPSYIIIGPAERAMYPNLVIRDSWRIVAEKGAYKLYAK